MAKFNGVDKSDFLISGDRVGSGLLQGVERRMQNSRPVAPEKQEKIDQILFEMKNSSDRMQKLIEVFSRINRKL